MSSHTVCHIEFSCTDLARSQAFYGAIFDWKFASFGDSMVVFGSGDQHLGGLMKVDALQPGDSPSVWFEVASVEETLGLASGAGGEILSPRREIPGGIGFSGVFTDPAGNRVAVVEFAPKPSE